ncbi:MAG: hypothetical protein ACXW61_14970 [Gemmatirosa sp.]
MNAPHERRYDDREVALIFKGAASAEMTRSTTNGLTLPELERVAVEAGLDPSLVRRAAAELDTRRDATLGDRWRGGPKVLVVERVIEGEVAPDASDALLATVRGATGAGGMGTASTVGRTFTWRGQLDGAQTDVGVVPAAGRTTVQVRVALDALSQNAFAAWLMAAGGGGVLAFAALVNPIGAAALLPAGAVVGVGYLLARRRFARQAARLHARAQALADAVATAAARR